MAETLNQDTFPAFLEDSTLPVLADFYRDGCVPCRRIAPLVSRAESEYAGQLAVVRVNTTANPQLTRQYDVQAAPTLILFSQGEEKARHRGVIDREGLRQFLSQVLPENPKTGERA